MPKNALGRLLEARDRLADHPATEHEEAITDAVRRLDELIEIGDRWQLLDHPHPATNTLDDFVGIIQTPILESLPTVKDRIYLAERNITALADCDEQEKRMWRCLSGGERGILTAAYHLDALRRAHLNFDPYRRIIFAQLIGQFADDYQKDHMR